MVAGLTADRVATATRDAPTTAPGWTLPAFLLLALVLRGWDLGNPVLDLDEQWYLLVGDRMLRGAAPFIDLWDRKPAGLFLLFAGFRLIPGDGVVVYQLAARIVAGATAFVVARIAGVVGASTRAGAAAGALYLLAASVVGGQGGQAPVFYNLPVALAALAAIRLPLLDEAREVARIMRARPPVVVTTDRQRTIWNVDSRRIVMRALAADYRLALVAARGRWHTLVYVRRDRLGAAR